MPNFALDCVVGVPYASALELPFEAVTRPPSDAALVSVASVP